MILSELDKFSENYAISMDRQDPLKIYRNQFSLTENSIYMDGNSLGLMPKKSETSIQRILNEWKTLGINGWLEGKIPWFFFAEEMGKKIAPIVGAKPSEVIMTGTTTVNIHTLVDTFYQPKGKRTKILADELNFPTDIYALMGQIRMHGLDPAEELILIPSENGLTLTEERIIERMQEDVALVFLPSVLYCSGQLLDIHHLTQAAHKDGICVGFDCAHSVGAIPHKLHEWDVDFAVWCGYKYLNGGPGAPGFLYVNEKHFHRTTNLLGWFGYVKEKQFDMALDYEKAYNAGGWQISSPGIIASGGVEGALEVTLDAGIAQIRQKSLNLTQYLIELTDHYLKNPPYNIRIGTPRESYRRGGHIALLRDDNAYQICKAMKKHGIIPDFRPPNIIRIAPIALYNSYDEIWQVVQNIKKIIDTEEFLEFSEERSLIS
ncbi:MAG: kynureninase [Candidatus Lokiarchaeota archaeon]|nr:kynureninase [Candidatus Lokiarchaeota archaeon]